MRTAAALLFLLSLATWPLAAQSKGGGIFDSLALAKLLAPLKNGPKTPQPVLLAFAEDGSLDRLALSDSIPSQLRDLLRDSLPHVVRTDSAFANLRVRLFLVTAKPLMLVPACDELPPQFVEPSAEEMQRALVPAPSIRTARVEVENNGGVSSRDVQRALERALPKPVQVRLTVAMVVLPGGRVTGGAISSLSGSGFATAASPRALEGLSIKPAPGASWTTACLYRTIVERLESPPQ